jgi:signal transduction histidine kinase
VNALEWQASQFDKHMGIPCSFATNDENIALDEEKTMVLFRVCQEALSNVAKHAKANLVTIKLTRFADEINMQITDNGIGISARHLQKKNAFGIHGMYERVISLKGSLSIQPGSKNGTEIMVKLPE